jgi:hypothetical protein
MGKLESRGYSAADADGMRRRARESHTQRWQAGVYKWRPAAQGGPVTLVPAGTLPIVSGTLTLDSSDPIRRKLTMEIGGGDKWAAKTYLSPLVPFGQYIVLWSTIDRADGTWFPWLKQGEFAIQSYVYERPSQVATVEATDYSGIVDQFLFMQKRSYAGKTVAGAVKSMVDDALPGAIYEEQYSEAARTTKLTSWAAPAASSRWDQARALTAAKGFETFFDSTGKLIIRHDVTDDDNDSLKGVGPDIGTTTSPVITINDGDNGNLVGMTASVTREGGCNAVAINISGQVTRKAKKQTKAKGTEMEDVSVTHTVTATQSSGAVAWGESFGFLPVVINKSVKKLTDPLDKDPIVKAQQTRANRLLHRRRGVIRYLDIDMLPALWLEPDDKIKVDLIDGTVEYHYAQRVEIDLTGQSPMRLRTRQLSVTDPGSGF